jgi:hypothetical protein
LFFALVFRLCQRLIVSVRFKFFKMSKYNLSLKKVTKPKINVLSDVKFIPEVRLVYIFFFIFVIENILSYL